MFNAFKFGQDLLDFDSVQKVGDRIFLTKEGKKTTLRLVKTEGSRYSIEVLHADGQSTLHTVDVLHRAADESYRMALPEGEVACKALQNADEAAAEEANYSAPMTAKVISVHIEPGKSVEVGEVLMVLEAMKLQIEIKAHQEAIVDRVMAKAGEQVQQGDVLVHMKEAEEPQDD